MREEAEKVFRLSVINLGLIRCKEIMVAIEHGIDRTPLKDLLTLVPTSAKRKRANESKLIAAGMEPVTTVPSPKESKRLQEAQDELMRTGTHPIIPSLETTKVNKTMECVKIIREFPGHTAMEYDAMLEKKFPNVKARWYMAIYNVCNPNQAAYKGMRRIGNRIYPPETQATV